MKLLIVAPDIAPSWTEGRKNFVRDLIEVLTRYVTVRLVTTGRKNEEWRAPCPDYRIVVRSRWQKLLALHRGLNKALADWGPDAVCHFPFGTFHGLRGLANLWSIRHIDYRSEKNGLRCLTVLYSVTKGSGQTLKKIARELVLEPSGTWSDLHMAMGINTSRALRVVPNQHDKPTILFMAGLQETRHHILRRVLNERGLEDIVEAGPFLEKAGVRLIVAIPLLMDKKLREELKRQFIVRCPNLDLDLRFYVSVPEIFAEVDLYLFPFKVELTQFVPTSILEAMAAGVPVVLSDLLMLSPLVNGGRTAYVHRRSDSNHLWEVIKSALADENGRRDMAFRAREFVKAKWTIERSVEDLLNILDHKKFRSPI